MTQEVPYNVIKKIGVIEIRQYPKVIFAIVEDNINDSGFGLLFQYISGENKTRRKIAMTAPVVTSEKIKMTAPVISRKNYMAFALPSSYSKETVPVPTNPAVKIEIHPEKTMAVLRFGGRSGDTRVQKYIQELITALKNHTMQIKGEPVLMRYNSPFTPGFLRRNEVAVEIDNAK
ncbi:MAG TPA: heme-binding protein [Candidatus Thermoplasmatota archaeon]|nr:heme-binding protein [Candidatus Thermoplasmatota archaeon]